ncbi:MAG TPA: filamin/ABP280 repeat domain-containing protein [Gemmatimonadaceae bacterium]|nr:filamin/ABP280 repeat domain-containing protein [Gemmatimonadaceae bacterium]
MTTELSSRRAALLVCAAAIAFAACSDADRPMTAPASPRAAAVLAQTAAQSYTLIGAGDIAGCGSKGDEKTASLVLGVLAGDAAATVFTAGDNAYENGSAADYANCYDPSWGQFKGVTHAALGNHEYNTGTADPSFDYFGSRVGNRGEGWHSIDLGDWHIVFLNSNRDFVSLGATGPQVTWLKADLAATTKQCIVAIWQDPLFYGNQDGGAPGKKSYVKPFWDALYAAGAEIVVNGNKHDYERFMPQDPGGNPDPNGIREFIVGTGGRSVSSAPIYLWPTSEVQQGNTFGVLKLTLGPGTYGWEFLAVPGTPFTDTGSGTCSGWTGAGSMTMSTGDGQTAPAGTAVSIAPAVRLLDASGVPLTGVTVTFAVRSGGGSITGATPVTDANGIATVGSWTLGPAAGANTLAASAPGVSGSPLTFTATATITIGAANAAQSTATVPNGAAGAATTITVQARDQNGVALTTGGATVVVSVSGANSATPTVTDNGNGTYTAQYTPTRSGTDQVAITLNGSAIGGSPYTSNVVAGAPAVQTIVAGNNQTAPAGTAVPIPPSLRLTDAFGNPVAGWPVLFSVVTGGGSVTGAQTTTDANGVATVGSWTLGPIPGKNQLKGRATGSSLSNSIFNATGS